MAVTDTTAEVTRRHADPLPPLGTVVSTNTLIDSPLSNFCSAGTSPPVIA